MRGRCVGFLPHDHFMALLQTQALHSEDHPFQHTRQGVGEGDLGGHLLADHSISQRLPEGNSKKVRRVEPNLSRNKSKTANTEKRKKKSKTYFDGKIRCTEPEGGLVGQYLLGLTDSSRQGQHQSGLVHQLVLVLLVRQDPLNGLFCLKRIQAQYQAYLSAGLSFLLFCC